ncbi:unnamed protein product [Peronospora belbahrii]|uniref:Uncharacterized protein n=1 Tax=Peronospora belbahrii TaxID=622444 RepID=A0ABN8CZM4_9STRA|nr:unnamed protein product [Peronospora belbahrii]
MFAPILLRCCTWCMHARRTKRGLQLCKRLLFLGYMQTPRYNKLLWKQRTMMIFIPSFVFVLLLDYEESICRTLMHLS